MRRFRLVGYFDKSQSVFQREADEYWDWVAISASSKPASESMLEIWALARISGKIAKYSGFECCLVITTDDLEFVEFL